MPQWVAAALIAIATATAATGIATNAATPSGCQMLCISGASRESSLLLDVGAMPLGELFA